MGNNLSQMDGNNVIKNFECENISIFEGALADFKADVFVNSSNVKLNLKVGALSKSLLDVAGNQLQTECIRKYPNGIKTGGLAVTMGYRLKCQYVYHGALPYDSITTGEEPTKVLCKFVCACLKQAHDDKMTSIAFPPLGCGELGYPPDVAAQIMYECIATFRRTYPRTTLTSFAVVIYRVGQDSEDVKQAFIRHLKLSSGDLNLKVSPVDNSRKTPNFISDFSKTCTRLKAHNACKKVLPCGHVCSGFRNETSCPPCLVKNCNSDVKQTREDDCIICFTEELSAAPVIVLECGHTFHLHCVKRVLENRWVGARITFNFTLCPICKKLMTHEELQTLLVPIKAIKAEVEQKAMMRLQYEGLDQSEDPLQLAMERYCYYLCHTCGKVFFGGAAQCDAGNADGDFSPEDLVCPVCSQDGGQVRVCHTHGEDFLAYKCRYCCSIASFFCFGNTHFCNECHDDFSLVRRLAADDTLPKCPAGPRGNQLHGKCSLRIEHPSPGEEYCLGCTMCAHVNTF